MSWPPIQRAPCGGWQVPEKLFLSGAENHYNLDENNIPFYRNTTLVPNPICTIPECHPSTPCTANVPPFPRPDCTRASQMDSGDPKTCAQAICGVPYPVPANTYELNGTRNLATCRKFGFKNAYAIKNWHGRFGFFSTDPNGVGDSRCLSAGLTLESARLTSDDTKYLKMTGSASHALTAGVGGDDESSDASRGMTVDRYSGKQTITDCSQSGTDGGAYAISMLGSWKTISGVIGYALTQLADWENLATIHGVPFTVTWDSDKIGFEFTATDFHGTGTATFHIDWGAKTATYYDNSNSSQLTVEALTTNLTLTNTHYHYDFHQEPHADSVDPEDNTWDDTCDVYLDADSAYTAEQLDSDVNGLLAEWGLGSDILQPWRTDGNLTTGPLVTYNERGPTQPTTQFDCTVFAQDDLPYPEQPEGAVIGRPIGDVMGWVGAYSADPYFDFRHQNWVQLDDGTYGEVWVVDTVGAYAPSYIPNATQWIDNYTARLLPPGAFIAYGPASDFYGGLKNPYTFRDVSFAPIGIFKGQLIKCKWWEVTMPLRPTHNFARPCGGDKDERGANASLAIIDATDTTPVVITTASAHGLSTGDKVTVIGVLGNDGANGAYAVTATSSTQFQLEGSSGTGAYGGGGLVQRFVCGSVPLGTLRWPSAPCFCNDPAQIANCDTPDNPSNDYVWNDKWKKGEFTIDTFEYDFRAFFESYRTRKQHLDVVNTNIADPDHPCDVPAQLDPFNYIENEDGSIGSGSYFLKAMTRTQKCSVHFPCFPSMAVIQPDAPIGVNSSFITMPYIPADERYGTLWIARVNQWMTDPLWKAPGKNYLGEICDDDCLLIAEDDGTCQEDDPDLTGLCYFPMRPWEENLSAVPDGSPALPAGSAQVGCAGFIGNLNGDPWIGNPGNCYPQLSAELDILDGGGYAVFTFPQAVIQPWTIRLNQEDCVRRNGRFAAEYIANGIDINP